MLIATKTNTISTAVMVCVVPMIALLIQLIYASSMNIVRRMKKKSIVVSSLVKRNLAKMKI